MIDDYIEKWILKAINDLKVAEHELKQPANEIVTDAICFHCQQAVEIRYPDEFYIPSIAEAKECFSIASKDKDFLLKKIN